MQQPEHLLRAQTPTFTTSRAISVGLVIIFHVLVIIGFASGLAQHLITKLPDEFKAEVVKEQIPVKPPPPPPPPDLVKPPPPFVPPPTIIIQQETAPVNTITTTNVKPPPEQKATGITAPASIGRAHECGSNYYPPIAQRLSQEGTTTISFRIMTDGSVSDVKVTDTSGHDSLDTAAIRCAGGWHYRPAMQNGQPVEVPWSTKVIWKLPQ
jgi:protein TonB